MRRESAKINFAAVVQPHGNGKRLMKGSDSRCAAYLGILPPPIDESYLLWLRIPRKGARQDDGTTALVASAAPTQEPAVGRLEVETSGMREVTLLPPPSLQGTLCKELFCKERTHHMSDKGRYRRCRPIKTHAIGTAPRKSPKYQYVGCVVWCGA